MPRQNVFEERGLQIHVGQIIEVFDFPEAKKPAYKLKIDLGQLGIKWSSCQATILYAKGELLGRKVQCVTNLPPLQVGRFRSEILVNGCYLSDGSVVLIFADERTTNGSQVC